MKLLILLIRKTILKNSLLQKANEIVSIIKLIERVIKFLLSKVILMNTNFINESYWYRLNHLKTIFEYIFLSDN